MSDELLDELDCAEGNALSTFSPYVAALAGKAAARIRALEDQADNDEDAYHGLAQAYANAVEDLAAARADAESAALTARIIIGKCESWPAIAKLPPADIRRLKEILPMRFIGDPRQSVGMSCTDALPQNAANPTPAQPVAAPSDGVWGCWI